MITKSLASFRRIIRRSAGACFQTANPIHGRQLISSSLFFFSFFFFFLLPPPPPPPPSFLPST